MSQTIQIVVLCLVAISCAQNQNSCCSGVAESQPAACPNSTPPPTTTPCPNTTPTPSTTPCPYASSHAIPESTPSTTTGKPSSGELARQPDPNTTGQPTPNYVLVPGYPGIPNMPSYPPYPLFGNYMPIVQDPTTGQKYFVMRNPFMPTNKYSQILNVYAPDMNPGYYAVSPANNGTSTEKPSDKS